MTRQGPVDESPNARPSQRDPFPCLTENDAIEYLRRPAGVSVDTAVQKHLDTCAMCRVLVAEAARTTQSAGSQGGGFAGGADQPQTLSVGEVIMDRYEIVRFAARGGMGEVYEARDSILKEVVALKTLACTALDDPRAVHRLLDEVRLARQVTHPNVCRILEFGLHQSKGATTADAIPFLTMEFLRSETLDQRISREGKLSPAYVATILPQIVAGLGAIHAAGIVHRDIKPQNIFLLPGPPERLVLTDFGVARGLDGTPSGQSATGPVIVGTLDYMAPEQLEGKPPSPSFDIYALGVVIFEMLTGRMPFSGTSALATIVERFRRPPPRPSELVPGLDPVWDKIVAGCMAPDPNRRFTRAEQLLEPGWKAPPRAGFRRWLEPRFALLLVGVVAAAGAFARWSGRARGNDRGGQVDGGAASNAPGACTEEAGLPYVVSASYNMLYRFDPAELKFTKLGMIKCPTGAGVNAMTVDRSGSLWVNYLDDGKIYKVNPQTLVCEPTAYVAGGGIGFSTALSMQFLADGPGADGQTLFVSDHTGDAKSELTGKGLARLDLSTMRLTALGPFTGSLSGHMCELSGTRDGHLFGFFEGSPAVLTEIDTRTGATPNPRPLPGVATNGAYAFSLWGGLFWLYTTLPAPDHTKVTRFDPKSGETKVVIPSVGFQIVGAGVSSCAPAEMPGPHRAVLQITAGAQHNCVLFADGNVRCWGDNSHGQLGLGHTRAVGVEETPASAGDVPVGGPVRQISAGDFHTCAVLETGKVRCWGNGSQGQLGYGNTKDIGDDETPASAGDVDIGGPARAVSAGGPHTCAVLETGKVRCWGRGDGGHLGYGNKASIGDDETPASAGDVDVGGPVRQIVAGSHTCALLENGNVRCWAGGSDGRLGYANLKNIGKEEHPSSAGDIKLGGKARQIAMGQFHTCALLDTGKIRCWGSGSVGQLGYDGTDNVGDNETPASAGDVNVGGTVRQIAAGGNDTCALLTTGRVRCWGLRSGPLSAGSGYIDVGAGMRQVVMGSGHTCLLLDTGKVRCWGDDHHGQLGAGHKPSSGDLATSVPVDDISLE